MTVVCFNCRAPAPLHLNIPCACGSTTWTGVFGSHPPLPYISGNRIEVIREVAAWIDKQADLYLAMAENLPPEDAALVANLADSYRLAAGDVRSLDPEAKVSELKVLADLTDRLRSILKPSDA